MAEAQKQLQGKATRQSDDHSGNYENLESNIDPDGTYRSWTAAAVAAASKAAAAKTAAAAAKAAAAA